MDKGTQKEMDRLGKFTKRQRREYVDRMIAARLNGSTVIHSYNRMPGAPLPPIPQERKKGVTLGEILIMEDHVWLNESEAEQYFSHLVSIVTEASKPDDQDIFQGIHSVDEAYEQLWIAFNQMLPDIEMRENPFADNSKRLDTIERDMTALKSQMDRRDAKTEEALKLILNWKKMHDRVHQRDKAGFNRIVKKS
ncbi:MAG: hypothetical protein ABSD99_12725 [Candidatus Bathyarchaeia archaeon]